MKPIAIFLFLVLVTGATAVTGSAYAQSNTDLIASTNENTSAIKDTVDSIVDTLGEFSDTFKDMLAKLDSILASTTDITADLADVKSSISGFNDTFASIQAGTDANKNTLNGLTAQVLEMNEGINDIKSTFDNPDDSALGKSLNQLRITIDDNNQRLQSIEASLVDLESKINTQTQTPQQPPPTSITLVRNTITTDVSSYDYKAGGVKRTVSGETVYLLDMKFGCDGPVSIDTVETSVTTADTAIIPTSTPNSTASVNYLKVNNQDLYHSKFEVSANTFTALIKDAELNLQRITTGDTLDFSSRQVENNDAIANSTRDDYAFDYQITIEYLGDISTKCILDKGGDGTGINLEKSDSVYVTVDIDSDSIIKKFSERISCGNNPVEITNIDGSIVGEGWDPSLASYAELKLAFPKDSNSDTTIGFEADGTLSSATYPIAFANSDMIVSGNLPNVKQMLVEITYSTVSGGSCAVQ